MTFRVKIWNKAPFLRLLLPLMTGIILEWEFQFSKELLIFVLVASISVLLVSFLLPAFSRYKLNYISGIAINALFCSFGCFVTWSKDVRHDRHWFQPYYNDNDLVQVVLDQPLAEKANSYKATATVTAIYNNKKRQFVSGQVILYFKKDSAVKSLGPGSQVLFSNSLQEIKNAGNPAEFDYKRFCLFEGITHQAYLQPGDFVLLQVKENSFPESLLLNIRNKVLSALRNNIHGEKELGLAEALLIGYKDDLDKDLVQSYTNTGVVHIIAISGLHLGLIYGLMILLLRPLRKRKNLKWISAIIVIVCLWLFSLLAGAQASVVRSAVMFTCIVIGESFSKRSSIYNTLAASAFILLCYNPFWLWDVGFQLSYAAVLSIVIFMRPVYNLFYIKNKLVDAVWKLNAVSIAAQLLTTPFSLYHFHQFPNFFLLTNFIAVPLSSIIVLGEIFLCSVSFLPFVAMLAGKILGWLIWLMDSYIERIEALPYSLWQGMQINVFQAFLLLLFIAAIAIWLIEKQKPGLWLGLGSLFLFTTIRALSFYTCDQQRMIIIYNLPKHTAIDFIDGRKYHFVGDSDLVGDPLAINFYIKPCRMLYRLVQANSTNSYLNQNYFRAGNKHVLLVDENLVESLANNVVIDLLIISKNVKTDLVEIIRRYHPNQIVFDSSVPAWKINSWMKDSLTCLIPFYNVNESGAFIIRLDN